MKAAKTKTGNDEGNIRLVDVAKRADVSVATVSRVMNTPQVVRPDVRQRVNDVIKEMGYTRNAAARALRSQSNRLFGALVPTLNQAIYAAMIDALQRRLSEKGYLLVVGQTDFSPETELLHVNALIEHGAEALVLVGHAHSPELYQLLERKKIPFINTYTYSPDSGHPCVGFDNALATRQMADFVMDLGHQDVAMIVGITKNNDRATERLEGVRQAIAARGMTLNPDYVFESRYTIDGGRHAMRQLLRLERPPTAVLTGSDVLAFGALVECKAQGIAVPEQVSIVGFDDMEFAAHLDPPLTTLQVPVAQMGQNAADYLLACVANEPRYDQVELETRLVVRKTTAKRK
ncbi:MAG: LacI family DNA-binding transcriptional regulator [Rhizobiales bacterium]|jgi:LacI family transcriptional regulator|nr:LacI family DNA-binding transcriptional regulator [Hyphomicrobiales bacterium]